MIYAAEQAEDIALVADNSRLCRPDLVLWCVDSRSLSREAALELMEQADSLFKPTKGNYVIANNPWPEPAEPIENEQEAQPLEQASRVHLLTVGYDHSKLMPVVEALAGQPDPPLIA